MNIFHAHGKLLLSAEYMVLFGSKALALPLNQGQTLERIRSDNRGAFSWSAYFGDERWFYAWFDPQNLGVLETSDMDKATWLQEIIRACIGEMPAFQQDLFNWDVVTRLDFPPSYGFGSSSTLIALLAEWAEINPLDLHSRISGGSGFDVACAVAEGPIIYYLRDGSPHYRHVPFRPGFSRHLYFVWLGKKQPTASHLREVEGRINPDYETIHHFSELTGQMCDAATLDEFKALMEEHEERLSAILGMEPVSSRFDGLPGCIKSLGAWGGDFAMIATEEDQDTLEDYLKHQGIRVVYNYNDIVYDAAGL